jgi:hypothetical protein
MHCSFIILSLAYIACNRPAAVNCVPSARRLDTTKTLSRRPTERDPFIGQRN